MIVSDVGREGVRLVSQLTGVAISVPVVAGVRPARGCRARRSVAPRRRAQGARSQAESTGAAQGRVEKRGRLRPSRRSYYDHVEGEEGMAQLPLPSVIRLGGGANDDGTLDSKEGDPSKSKRSSSVLALASRTVRCRLPRKRFSIRARSDVWSPVVCET